MAVNQMLNKAKELPQRFSFYEFFAGGGMVRLGLGENWHCTFANDFDAKKVAAYRANFDNAPELIHDDIRNLDPDQLPGRSTLAWASFPCQDLSLAGSGAGLKGERSGVFWPFWNLMLALRDEGRKPPIIALENVAGLITSHGGEDLTNLVKAFSLADYRIGAVVIDGALFVPQSRPRLFLVAVDKSIEFPEFLESGMPNHYWHPKSLRDLVDRFAGKAMNSWVWWNLPVPVNGCGHLQDVIELEPTGVDWHDQEATNKILNMMSPANLKKVEDAQRSGILQVGTIYKRTRKGQQRAEVRFDGISGCLRTPAGGSSRQIIMIVEGDNIRTRLISPRETARLMGLPESYDLPERYNEAYHLTGDGVVVPAVSWLEQHILYPLALSVNAGIKEETKPYLSTCLENQSFHVAAKVAGER